MELDLSNIEEIEKEFESYGLGTQKERDEFLEKFSFDYNFEQPITATPPMFY